jgi:hypothetical protein
MERNHVYEWLTDTYPHWKKVWTASVEGPDKWEIVMIAIPGEAFLVLDMKKDGFQVYEYTTENP